MLGNYLITAFRNVLRHKGTSLINVVGLASGMACCIVIFLYVASELSYDQYHQDADRVFRIAEHRVVKVGEFRSARICPSVAPALRRDYSQVEAAVRIDPVLDGLVKTAEVSQYEDNLVLADPELFQIFSIPFVSGNPDEALREPFTVVLSRSAAWKYLGSEDVLGKTIAIGNPTAARRGLIESELLDYRITGVVEDPPSNTHFKYAVIASLKALDGNPRFETWDASTTYTYVKVKSGVDPARFENDIRRLAYRYYGSELTSWGQERDYFLQPLADIHFGSRLAGFGFHSSSSELEPPGSMKHIYVYAVIGIILNPVLPISIRVGDPDTGVP